MNPLDYLKLQLRLEGKEIIKDNLLRQVETVPNEELPLMLTARLADENFESANLAKRLSLQAVFEQIVFARSAT